MRTPRARSTGKLRLLVVVPEMGDGGMKGKDSRMESSPAEAVERTDTLESSEGTLLLLLESPKALLSLSPSLGGETLEVSREIGGCSHGSDQTNINLVALRVSAIIEST